jgi:hypothetical protein
MSFTSTETAAGDRSVLSAGNDGRERMVTTHEASEARKLVQVMVWRSELQL